MGERITRSGVGNGDKLNVIDVGSDALLPTTIATLCTPVNRQTPQLSAMDDFIVLANSTRVETAQPKEDAVTYLNKFDANARGVDAMGVPATEIVAARRFFPGGGKMLASAATIVIPALFSLGFQMTSHGWDFLRAVVSGDASAVASAAQAISAGALTVLALRHHQASSQTAAKLEALDARLAAIEKLLLQQSAAPAEPKSPPVEAASPVSFQFVYDGADHFTISRG